MTQRSSSKSETSPHSSDRRIERMVRELEQQRDQDSTRRWWSLLIFGLAISIPIHIAIMIYLSMVHRPGSARQPEPMLVEFAVSTEEELTESPEQSEFEELTPEAVSDLNELSSIEQTSELEASPPVKTLQAGEAGSVSALGGAGIGEGGMKSLGGGAAGTSFFGISSKGTRFAYVVDVSGSMEAKQKMWTAMAELKRSINGLPDYAYFQVLLYNSSAQAPPNQSGWVRARGLAVSRLKRWLDDRAPGGGTQPMSAFRLIFAVEVMPDVIFFMTDGQIPEATATAIAALNPSGRQVTINTIAFGDPSSQDILKQIAEDSGGVYRFVPVSGQ